MTINMNYADCKTREEQREYWKRNELSVWEALTEQERAECKEKFPWFFD